MEKVLIIGSKGMAGNVIYHYFKENTDYKIIDIARGTHFHIPSYQLDVSEFKKIKDIVNFEKPAVVINCIGILNKNAEDNPDKAILINSYFPHFLARLGNETGFKLIHISTDCVFDGKEGNYTEQSEKTGRGFYAETKSLGEVEYGRHLTLRTSIIGPEIKENGIGLFDWFMKQNGTIKGYTHAYWTGVSTLELAKAINESIKQDISGLQHLVNEEKINKFDLVTLFKNIFERDDLIIEPFDGYKTDKSLLRTKRDFKYCVPSYNEMLIEMKDWMDNHKSHFPHYFV